MIARRYSYSDLPSFKAALKVYCERHPDVPECRAAEVTGKMICALRRHQR